MTDPRAGSATPWGRIALAWLLLSALLLFIIPARLTEWQMPDTDDSLRLVQVRDLIAGQGWFDLHQYRIDPGASPVMHWSRLVDVPLLLIITLLAPLIGQVSAEHAALVLVPLLTLGAILAVVGRMALRLFGREIVVFVCLACGLSSPLLAQLQPLRIDHHGWQVFTVILALGALLHRRAATGGMVAGIAMAAGLSISLEVLPLTAAFAGVLLLRWLRDGAQRGWLTAYLGSLAAGLALFFAGTRGFGDLSAYCDVIAPAHLAFFAIAALGTGAVAARRKMSPAMLIGLLGVAGAAGLATFLALSPQCLSGPFGSLDPLVREYWYVHVFEGQPFWVQPLGQAIPIVAQGFVALGATLYLWRTAERARRAWWLEYVLLLGAALLVGLLVWRSMAFVGAISAVPIGWLAHRLLMRFRAAESPAGRIGVVLAAIAALLPSSPTAFVELALPAAETEKSSTLNHSSCDVAESVRLLRRFEPATVFAPFDLGPAVLERTRLGVVATSHHRAQLAMHDVILGFTSPEAEARALVRRHGAHYLVICTDMTEPRLYAAAAPHGLMAQLLAGNPPAWLAEVPLGAPATFKVWKVIG